jgi:hypothetical protein
MSNLALNASRADYFNVKYKDPNVIVRIIDNPNHPQFDARGLRPADPEMVASLKMRGQEQPAKGYKLPGLEEGKQVVVLTMGRGRWKGIQVAWEQLLAEGVPAERLPPFKVIVQRYASDADAFEAAIVENEHRLQVNPMEKAQKLLKYLNLVGDDSNTRERARVLFNFKSMLALESALRLNDLIPDAQILASDGTLTASAAFEIACLNPAQQAKALEKVKSAAANGEKITVKAMKDVARIASGKAEIAKTMGRKDIKTLLAEKEAKLAQVELAGMATGTGALILKGQIEVLKQILGESQEEVERAVTAAA